MKKVLTAEDLRKLGLVGPGDPGPCPHCGEEMGRRYWHMIEEHGIYEHYQSPDHFLKGLTLEQIGDILNLNDEGE